MLNKSGDRSSKVVRTVNETCCDSTVDLLSLICLMYTMMCALSTLSPAECVIDTVFIPVAGTSTYSKLLLLSLLPTLHPADTSERYH